MTNELTEARLLLTEVREKLKHQKEVAARTEQTQAALENRLGWTTGSGLVLALLVLGITVYTTTKAVTEQVAPIVAKESAKDINWVHELQEAITPEMLVAAMDPTALESAVQREVRGIDLRAHIDGLVTTEMVSGVLDQKAIEQAVTEALAEADYDEKVRDAVTVAVAKVVRNSQSIQDIVSRELQQRHQELTNALAVGSPLEANTEEELITKLTDTLRRADPIDLRVHSIDVQIHPFGGAFHFRGSIVGTETPQGRRYGAGNAIAIRNIAGPHAERIDTLLGQKAKDTELIWIGKSTNGKFELTGYQEQQYDFSDRASAARALAKRLVWLANQMQTPQYPVTWRFKLSG